MSLRGTTNGRDAAIHRVSEERVRQCGSFVDSQWIATPFRLAMTRVVVSPSISTLHSSLFTLPEWYGETRDDKTKPENGIRALESCRS